MLLTRWACVVVLFAGNDLARCLNWGGGLGSVRSRGLDHCLLEVALAQQVQVDRWRVTIEPQVCTAECAS